MNLIFSLRLHSHRLVPFSLFAFLTHTHTHTHLGQIFKNKLQAFCHFALKYFGMYLLTTEAISYRTRIPLSPSRNQVLTQ